MEDLAWQNGSRFFTIMHHVGGGAGMITSGDRKLATAFLTATSRMDFMRIGEICHLLATEMDEIASTSNFSIKCAGEKTFWCHTVLLIAIDQWCLLLKKFSSACRQQ